ncbi:protein MLN51 homolog isoform X2 [Phragmites australis]|uniref:protein MLN51 homolog isoform X2 n=1 Tax=Phragmites australis TaxID=29695 RepID=UPI002D765C92|nr:protein MLN51 homolog isoform X2 [Phragmites australis]XP_062214275.1 protein MLN51 homolog isoform X2 [Phragmites australis]
MADPPSRDAQPEKPPAAPLTPEPDAAAAGANGADELDEEEYVSDPDDAPLPTMRRREASDDEGSEDGRPRVRIGPDHDDDGQGAPEAYDDEVDDDEDEEYYDEEEEEEVSKGLEEEYEGRAAAQPKEGGSGGSQGTRGEEGEKAEEEGLAEGEAEPEAEGEGEKEKEPFAVPTSGAFYMHDDRFQEENRGRRRRMFGGRKLWDAKDDQAWVHDRFEEMNVQDERYEDKRMSRGRFRGRGGGGKARGGGRGFPRGGKQHNYNEDGNTQNRPPKVVRGRGPRRYEVVARNSREFVGSQRKQTARFREPASIAAAAKESGQVSHAQPEVAPPKKNVISSSLNSASPPFYPSGASNQDFSVPAQRRDMQAGSNKVLPSSTKMDDNLKLQSGPTVRGKTAVDYGGRDRFHSDGPVRSFPGRAAATSLNSSGFISSSVNPGQSPIVKASGGNSSMGISSNNQPTSSLHQTSRISTQQQSHTSVMHQKSGQVPNQSATRIPTQQLSHRTNNPSPAANLPVKTTESDENGSYHSPNNSKTSSAVVKASNQETGRGSFMYGGAQVIGAAGISQGDQNFPGTPALLPVMQFGGQHPGGLGVPTVGMALPGYVAQQQMGIRNNEMTWLPLLAGAAGAFGGSYPPYIALDPSFYSRPSGQTSSSVPSREPTANRGSKSPPRNDIGSEELDQRQNKPRRYSEMNFSQ